MGYWKLLHKKTPWNVTTLTSIVCPETKGEVVSDGDRITRFNVLPDGKGIGLKLESAPLIQDEPLK